MLIEFTLWSLLLTNIQFCELLIESDIYIEAEQERSYLITKEEIKHD